MAWNSAPSLVRSTATRPPFGGRARRRGVRWRRRYPLCLLRVADGTPWPPGLGCAERKGMGKRQGKERKGHRPGFLSDGATGGQRGHAPPAEFTRSCGDRTEGRRNEEERDEKGLVSGASFPHRRRRARAAAAAASPPLGLGRSEKTKMAARVSQERPRSGFHPPKWTPGRRIGLNDEDRSLAIWASFGPGGSAKSWPRPRLWRERHGPPREKRARGWAVGHNVGARERWAARVETNSACFGL
jgi:hypothetical protein